MTVKEKESNDEIVKIKITIGMRHIFTKKILNKMVKLIRNISDKKYRK